MRRRTLAQIAVAQVEQSREALHAKASVRPARRGKGGRLRVTSYHPETVTDKAAATAAKHQLGALAEGTLAARTRSRTRAAPGPEEGRLMRQRVKLKDAPVAEVVARALAGLFALALIWYGAMLILLALKFSPSTVNALSGYRDAYDYLSARARRHRRHDAADRRDRRPGLRGPVRLPGLALAATTSPDAHRPCTPRRRQGPGRGTGPGDRAGGRAGRRPGLVGRRRSRALRPGRAAARRRREPRGGADGDARRRPSARQGRPLATNCPSCP